VPPTGRKVRHRETGVGVDDDRKELGSMGAYPSESDGSQFLTPKERRVLDGIEQELAASDALLDVAMTDGVRPIPSWLIWVGRAALVLMPLVLLLPFVWWSSIVALAGAWIASNILLGQHCGRGAL
jgi:hypothetical protein